MTLCRTMPWGAFFEADFMEIVPGSCILEPVLESFSRTAWCLQPDMTDRQLWELSSKDPIGNRALELEIEPRDSPLPFRVVYKTLLCFDRPMFSLKTTLGSCCGLSIGATYSTSDKESSERAWAQVHSLLKNLWKFLWAWFLAGVFHSTYALWKPVTMSHGHYSKGRTGKLQCALQPYCRYRYCSQASSLSGESWKNKPIRLQPFLFPREMNISW